MVEFTIINRAIKKILSYFILKVNQQYYVSKMLRIQCDDPSTIHIYGKVDFGSEPWLISMGNNIYITDGVKFLTHDGGTLLFRDRVPDLEITKPISLGSNVYIGNNAIILPGVSIGNEVIVGAGSVVTHDVPDHAVVAGVPAKTIKSTEEYFRKAQDESLHLGHLTGATKNRALMAYFGRATKEWAGEKHAH